MEYHMRTFNPELESNIKSAKSGLHNTKWKKWVKKTWLTRPKGINRKTTGGKSATLWTSRPPNSFLRLRCRSQTRSTSGWKLCVTRPATTLPKNSSQSSAENGWRPLHAVPKTRAVSPTDRRNWHQTQSLATETCSRTTNAVISTETDRVCTVRSACSGTSIGDLLSYTGSITLPNSTSSSSYTRKFSIPMSSPGLTGCPSSRTSLSLSRKASSGCCGEQIPTVLTTKSMTGYSILLKVAWNQK